MTVTSYLWSDHIAPAGLTSARPAATAVAVGALYASTDDGVIYRNNGTTWDVYASTGSTTLAALTDVDLTSLADGDMLVWDTTTSKWIVAVPPAAGSTTLAALTDVDLTGLVDGQMIVWDTTTSKWIVATPGAGGSTTLAALTDVDLTGLADGDMLVWDTTTSKWIVATVGAGGTAAGTTFVPTGGLSSTDVQAALAELDTEKAPLASPALTGNPTAPTPSAGDNDTSIATTAFVTNAVAKQPEAFVFALGDETTAITAGTKVTWRIPFAFTVTEIRASLTTASSSGVPAFDVKKNGTSMFSTTVTIDATEKTSKTAATAAVLSTTALADDDELTFIVNTAGTGAAGAKVTILGTRA